MTVFFDIDDTIYDRSQPFMRACAELYLMDESSTFQAYLACAARGDEVFEPSQRGEISMDEMYIYRYCMGFSDIGKEITPDEALEFEKVYRRCQSSIKISATMETILNLAAETFDGMGIITNGTAKKQRSKMEALGLNRWFDEGLTVISGEVGIDKPDKRIFILAQEKANRPAERLIYIGDSLAHDIIPAAELGWHTIWLNRRGAPAAENEAEFIAESEETLLKIISEMSSGSVRI